MIEMCLLFKEHELEFHGHCGTLQVLYPIGRALRGVTQKNTEEKQSLPVTRENSL